MRADAKTEPPPGYFEQVKTDLKRGNGASHAITPAQALLGGKWWSEQSGIAAMAATLELKPASGETFVQLKERCFAEIARRKA